MKMERDINYKNKRVYLITSEGSKFKIDAESTRKLAKIHRKKLIDVIFVESYDNHLILTDYCNSNETYPIDVDETNTCNPLDNFLHILSYIKKNPIKNVMANLIKKSKLEELSKYFEENNFPIEIV